MCVHMLFWILYLCFYNACLVVCLLPVWCSCLQFSGQKQSYQVMEIILPAQLNQASIQHWNKCETYSTVTVWPSLNNGNVHETVYFMPQMRILVQVNSFIDHHVVKTWLKLSALFNIVASSMLPTSVLFFIFIFRKIISVKSSILKLQYF